MKVVIKLDSGGSASIRHGWAKVFQSIGWDVIMWQSERKSCHDLFYEHSDISLLISTSYSVDRSVIKCLKNSPQTKIALFCSAWGPLINDIDRKEYPIDIINEQEKINVGELVRETKQEIPVFLHLPDRFVDLVIGDWKQIGCKPLGIMNGGDTFLYLGAEFKEQYRSDVVFCGGVWQYKGRNIRKTLIPLCETNYNIKIWGYGDWGVPQYLGYIDDNELKHAFKSAIVCPNISEPHSTEPSLSYDLVERNLKIPLADGFLISDKVSALEDVFGKDVVPTFTGYEEFKGLIDYYTTNPEKRLPLMEKQRKMILEGHTYFHRMHKLLKALGFESDSAKCLSKYEELTGVKSA